MKTHDQWKKAVVNLECFSSSVSQDQYILDVEILSERYFDGDIDDDKFSELSRQLTERSINKKYTGTAIFIEHESKYYLLTARHVVFDIDSVKRLAEKERSYQDSVIQRIFNKIVFVPTLDHFNAGIRYRSVLMNLNAGPENTQQYTFSKPNIDLAIISLSIFHKDVIVELLELGYQPISLADIEDGPSGECVDVYAIGFPGAVSKLGDSELNLAEILWTSSQFSLPTTSFGKISMLHKDLDYYWVDISIYQGNSGGPIIENGKLVGIVSSNALIRTESANDKTRIPFGRIIKSNFIKELLEEQIIKDIL